MDNQTIHSSIKKYQDSLNAKTTGKQRKIGTTIELIQIPIDNPGEYNLITR